jgi:hypothetical protein
MPSQIMLPLFVLSRPEWIHSTPKSAETTTELSEHKDQTNALFALVEASEKCVRH